MVGVGFGVALGFGVLVGVGFGVALGLGVLVGEPTVAVGVAGILVPVGVGVGKLF